MNRLTCIFFLSLIFHGQTFSQEIWPVPLWKESTPDLHQLDLKVLNDLHLEIVTGSQGQVHSLLIVRDGFLVFEKYYRGFHKDSIHTLQSVSKSFTSAIIGIALEQGGIQNVDEKILDFFPEITQIKNLDKRKKAITLKDLLTMRSGTDYHESGGDSPHFQLNRLPRGWDRFYINRPMIHQPGTRFQYDSGGVILMSAILKNRAGMHADYFMNKYLFAPLGIEKSFWFKNEEGHPHTGGGMHILPRDMARFGLLYLREGKWQDNQVIPKQWVKESFQVHVDFQGSRGHDVGYGYLWWILKPDPTGKQKQNIIAAKGYMGQYIFVIPEHDMVVVVTGGSPSGWDMRKPIDFLYSHILPAVKK